MNTKIKILFVEHDLNDLELEQYELKKGGIDFLAEIVETEKDYRDGLINFIPDIILSDYSLPLFSGTAAFATRNMIAPDTPFIFVSGTIGEENSIELMRNGLTDYVIKDKLFTLATKVKRALSEAEEKQEKKIAELRQKFDGHNLNALINNTSNLMWSVDKDYKLITSNQPFNDMVKLRFGKTIEKESNILDIGFKDEQLSLYKSYYQRAFAGETFTEIEYLDTPVESWTEISFYPIRNGNEVIGTACNSRDITKSKLDEIERTKITSDLIQHNKDLEQFGYIVSHNLRAPVANIIGISELLREFNHEGKEEIEIMRELSNTVKILDNVIKDLNYILRVKHEVTEMKVPVKFTEVIGDIKISIDNLLKKEQAEIITDFSPVDEIVTLKSYLYSIFYNLITNSIKYRRPGLIPKIEISSYKSENKITLLFKDNGLGIDLAKSRDQVFGLYRRFHSHTEGKGMGLFMVKTQAETLGGKISLQSEVNKGTEFKIEFENEK